MFKRLVIWVSVLLIAALMSIPAFGQTADLSLEWGSAEWLVNQFGGPTGDVTEFCLAASEDAAGWLAQFPELAEVCGFVPAEPVEEAPVETVEESSVS